MQPEKKIPSEVRREARAPGSALPRQIMGRVFEEASTWNPGQDEEYEGIVTRVINPPSSARNRGAVPQAPLSQAQIESLIEASTDEELTALVIQAVNELQRRLIEKNFRITQPAAPEIPISFDATGMVNIVRLPAVPAPGEAAVEATNWRVALISSDFDSKPLGLEIGRDAIIGREVDDSSPDIDLNAYHGEEMGVSRMHAMLRPTKDSLLLTDIGSTNGTYYNEERVILGEPREVENDDIISFGGLNMRVKILTRPGE